MALEQTKYSNTKRKTIKAFLVYVHSEINILLQQLIFKYIANRTFNNKNET